MFSDKQKVNFPVDVYQKLYRLRIKERKNVSRRHTHKCNIKQKRVNNVGKSK